MLWFSINYMCYGLWVFRVPTQIQLIVDHFSKTFCRVVQTILLMPKGQLLTKKKTHRAELTTVHSLTVHLHLLSIFSNNTKLELTTVHSLTVHFTYTHFQSFHTTQNWSLKFIHACLSHCDLYNNQIETVTLSTFDALTRILNCSQTLLLRWCCKKCNVSIQKLELFCF